MQNSIEEYFNAVGNDFVEKHYPIDNQTRRTTIMMVRRLDDHLSNTFYRCHRAMKIIQVPENFKQLLNEYVTYCVDIGNRPGTIKAKKNSCIIFLNYLVAIGCKDISQLTVDAVSKGCLVYSNKDGYAMLRQFLRYIFEGGLIKCDFSTIVPHFKRRQIVPSVYTPEGIKSMEKSINRSTDTGKRNYAIFLLAARTGLRSGDIASLRLSEINFSSCHIELIQEKNEKPLSVFMKCSPFC